MMAYGRGGYGDFAPYVPVGARLAQGRRAVEKLAKKHGRPMAPVLISGRKIATSFWGTAWCEHLEAHGDYANRLPRGRTYVRNGSVLDLHISQGKIEAYVAGGELYTVTIDLTRLAAARWESIIASCAGRIGSLISLLRGELSHDVLTVLTDRKSGLFPAPSEIKLRCSCPDGAYMCKHVAAVLYGVGARLDHSPELFFVLRQVDQSELLASAGVGDVLAAAVKKNGGSPGKRRIAANAVASVFGLEFDDAAPVVRSVAKKAAAKKVAAKKVAVKATKKAASKKSPAKKKTSAVIKTRGR